MKMDFCTLRQRNCRKGRSGKRKKKTRREGEMEGVRKEREAFLVQVFLLSPESGSGATSGNSHWQSAVTRMNRTICVSILAYAFKRLI